MVKRNSPFKIKTLMIILVIYILAIGIHHAHAKDYQLSKSEFLSRLDQKTITLEKTPVSQFPSSGNLPQAGSLMDLATKGMEKEFPGFKKEMWYAGVVISNDYQYSIFYEWYDRGCIFLVTNKADYKKLNPADQSDQRKAVELMQKEKDSYEKIDKKYCEQVIGITLPSGGLTKVKRSK